MNADERRSEKILKSASIRVHPRLVNLKRIRKLVSSPFR
jgi:hypothetical protein